MSPETGDLVPLVGRRRELAEIRRLVASPARLVTLTGAGGLGKTRLARNALAERQRSHRDGVWALDLADLVDPGLLGQSIADAMGVQPQGGEVPPAVLAGAVRDLRGLLFLDSCEHMLDAAADYVAGLLARCPHLMVLASSRLPA